MATTTFDTGAVAGPPQKTERLISVDILRGLVVILMALDHNRDFFHAEAWIADPTAPETSNLAVYATRWITHFCAPTFVLLAGMSAFIQGRVGKTRGELARFLLSRGAWLMLLELSVLNFAWNFSFPGFGLQVIWALGLCMVVLAGMIWLPRWAVLAVGVGLIAGHNLLDPIEPKDLGAFASLWTALHEGGPALGAGFVVYPVLPWIGVMALGYGLGPILFEAPAKRRRDLAIIGLSMIAAFFVIRGINVYGDPSPWTVHAEPIRTGFSFLGVQKYPPSLDYILITVGPGLLLLPLLEGARGWFADLLLVYGRAPLMFYIAHIYLIHALALMVGLAMGFEAEIFVSVMADPSGMVKAGWGFPLWVVYVFWLLVLGLLYPLCRWWGELKRRRTDWWLSYL